MSIILALAMLSSVWADSDLSDCPRIVVHDEQDSDWHDGCLGLDYTAGLPNITACQGACNANIKCVVWQLVQEPDEPKCWMGSNMYSCVSRHGDSEWALKEFNKSIIAGQRIQHGYVKVLSNNVANNEKVWHEGLEHVRMYSGDLKSKEERCKEFCYSDTTCTVWQIGLDETGKSDPLGGCYHEHDPGYVKGQTTTTGIYADGMIAGETILHHCDDPTTTPTPGILGTPTTYYVGGAVALLSVGGLAFATFGGFFGGAPLAKPLTTRKLLPAPHKPADPVVPQTSYFVPTYVPVTTTVPVTTVPVATYTTVRTLIVGPEYQQVASPRLLCSSISRPAM